MIAEPTLVPPSAQSILIVDDNPANLTVLGESLAQRFRVRAATSGQRALHLVRQERPDLILLDIMMPDMDGREVLARLRQDEATADIPVIFVTALEDTEHERAGLELGAVDYITKPLRPTIVLARVQAQLTLQRASARLRADMRSLESQVQRQQRDNQLIRDVTLRALARLAQTRDNETGRHILRTQDMVRLLATLASKHPRFAGELDEATIASMADSAPLHDIGKVGIPDAILRKPGPLTDAEWVVMRTHTTLGAEAIDRAEEDAHQSMPFLAHAKQIARHHHERWDGTGYPDRLAGEAIPLSARLMALADVFDAMATPRVYKPAIALPDIRQHLQQQRGRHFDPDLLDLLLDHFDEFCDICRRLADES